MTNTTRQFDTYVSRGVMLNNYANIFGLIMQMRQVSDHPDLLLRKHAEGGQNVLVCNICDEAAEDAPLPAVEAAVAEVPILPRLSAVGSATSERNDDAGADVSGWPSMVR